MQAGHRNRRPNRTAADRRAQYERATARAVSKLLTSFESLEHRGCQRSRLAAALDTALRRPEAATERAAWSTPGTDELSSAGEIITE